MKVFVSWSGELSKKVAQELKKWLPCIIQSIDIFYSPEDIEKGENWDSKISTELSECNYGIVCLTSENTNAPWINFEAGAITKTLESRVSALMVDIKTSEIQGPLKRYQATKIEKEDMWQLVSDINKVADISLSSEVLASTFNAIWDSMYDEIKNAIEKYKPQKKTGVGISDEKIRSTEVVEEILQLVRKQNVLLSSPEQLLPPEYFLMIQKRYIVDKEEEMIFDEILTHLERMLGDVYNFCQLNSEDEKALTTIRELHIFDFIELILHTMRGRGRYNNFRTHKRTRMLQEKYIECCKLIAKNERKYIDNIR